MTTQKTLGIIGLGKMGGNLALQAVEKGLRVVGKERKPRPDLARKGVKVVTDYERFFEVAGHPALIYLSLPAGPTIDTVLAEMAPHLKKSDVVMDGGNSFYLDSIRREEDMWSKGVYFLDCGTSGGLEGARNGACFMVGGRDKGIKLARAILRTLAVKDGFISTGPPGSGHFAKLVHNGIEFGMLEAIGEGVELLRGSEFKYDLAGLFKNWANGSVIRGWLVELMEKGLREQDLDSVKDYIEDTGEVNWLVQYAIDREIPAPIITQSVIELFKSRQKVSDDHRAISLIRHGFGGHPYGKDDYIRKERKTSRIAKM